MSEGNANLAALLVARAGAAPDAAALHATEGGRERTVTFGQLDDWSARGAAFLAAQGLRAGDAVLIFQPVSVDLYVALLAMFRLGLTAMFADPSAGRAHLARCCALGEPRAFLGPLRAHALRWASAALRRVPRPILTGSGSLPLPGAARWRALAACAPRAELARVGADTPALLTFTSGSTGQPKAAVRTHGFLRAQHRALAASLALEEGEVDLATLPIFVLANLASGVASVLPDADLRRPGRVRVGPVARQIRRLRPTRAAGSPAFFERLLAAGAPLESFRKIYVGGAPVFPELLVRLRAVATPDATVAAVYGSTEAEPMAHLDAREIGPEELAAMRSGQGLLAGRPVAAVRVRVIGDRWGEALGKLSAAEFAAATCPAGGAGEIVVAGEHVLPGYWRGQGDAETKFQVAGEVWHRTGDAGRLDAAGRLWLLGRCAARVSDARGAQYPLAVECAARLAEPWVRRCAFAAWRGRRVLLVETDGRWSDETAARLQSTLAWASLDAVRPVRRIPMDRRHNAKVDYVALAKLLR